MSDSPLPPPPGQPPPAPPRRPVPPPSAPSSGYPAPAELEAALKRLPHVRAARVVTDTRGRPVEVHVLASQSKHPKQVVRDVQSVAMASYGVELDRRLVSVVQLEDEEPQRRTPPAPAAGAARNDPPRPVFVNVASEQQGRRQVMKVTLRLGEVEAVGQAEGAAASSVRLRLAALATVDALRQLVAGADSLDVALAMVVPTPEAEVALSTVVAATDEGEEVLAGAAMVRDAGPADAMVRSVLSATNRRLSALAQSNGTDA